MRRNFWLLCFAVLALIVAGPHCTKDSGGSGGGGSSSTGGCGGSGGSCTTTTSATGPCGGGCDGSGAWGDGSDGSIGGGGTTTTTTTTNNIGGADGSDGVATPTCHQCACIYKSADFPPGCAEKCDAALNGGTTDFCNNAPAPSAACATCIKDTCGFADPATCL